MKVLKFYADWCGPCKAQASLFEKASFEVESINVDKEENENLVEKFGIKGLPTSVLVDDEGKEITRFVGLTVLSKFEAAITKYKNETNRK